MIGLQRGLVHMAVWTLDHLDGGACAHSSTAWVGVFLVEFEMRQSRRETWNLTFCFLRLHSPHDVVVLSARGGRVTGPCIGSDIALLGRWTTSLDGSRTAPALEKGRRADL
jgi:hypothetical protein